MKNTTFVRQWVPCQEKRKSTHTLWIYDAGDSQGFLFEDAQGRKHWTTFTFQSRGYSQDGCIQETGTVEYEIPLHYFSIESYPCSFTQTSDSLQVWLPEWKIQMSLNALDSSVQTQSHLSSLPSLVGPSHPTKQSPSSHHTSQQHPKPLPLRQKEQNPPALPAPPKSRGSKPKVSQPNEHNKRNTLPTQTSSPSSNPTSLSQQPKPNLTKPVLHHPRPPSKNPRHSHPMPVSRPDKQVSVSGNQTNSE